MALLSALFASAAFAGAFFTALRAGFFVAGLAAAASCSGFSSTSALAFGLRTRAGLLGGVLGLLLASALPPSALASPALALSAFGVVAGFLRLRAGSFAVATSPLSSVVAGFTKPLLAGLVVTTDAGFFALALSSGAFSAAAGSALATRRPGPRPRPVLAFGAASSLSETPSVPVSVLAAA